MAVSAAAALDGFSGPRWALWAHPWFPFYFLLLTKAVKNSLLTEALRRRRMQNPPQKSILTASKNVFLVVLINV